MSEIVETEDTLHGKPRVEGTRVGARTLYELHKLDGMETEEIAQQYLTIDAEYVKKAVEYVKEKNSD